MGFLVRQLVLFSSSHTYMGIMIVWEWGGEGEGFVPAQHGILSTLRFRVLYICPSRQEVGMAHDFGQFTCNGPVDIFDCCEVGGEKNVEIAL